MASRYERYQYIYGNTARAVEVAVPERREREPEPIVKQPAKKNVVRRSHRVMEFNSRFTLTLTTAVAALVIICVTYLHGQYQLSHQIQNISAKQTKLTALINENHAQRSNLTKSVNYDSIKEYAKTELGMVVPGEKYTIYYDGASSDYVRQYEDIPAAE